MSRVTETGREVLRRTAAASAGSLPRRHRSSPAMQVAGAAIVGLLCGPLPAAADPVTAADRHVILVTLDGVRTQELFAGMDGAIAADDARSGAEDSAVMRQRYWRETPEQRRAALMPWFWGTLAPAGMVIGNQARGSRVTVRNPLWFSYPGYSEMLTGQPQPDVQSNDLVRYPHQTALDYAQRKLGQKATEVAQIGSWDGFKMAASRSDGTFFMNGAFEAVPAALSTPEIDQLVALRKEIIEPWAESSNDTITFRIALEYLRKHQPRVLWLGLGQSDDWAHARRYDLVLEYLHLVDKHLAELWRTLQSLDFYRGRTTLIITTDHGRGRTPVDWIDHDTGVQGSQDIWVAILGPDTPALGEVSDFPDVSQGDIAATLLQCLGLDYRDFNPAAGPPVPGSFRSR